VQSRIGHRIEAVRLGHPAPLLALLFALAWAGCAGRDSGAGPRRRSKGVTVVVGGDVLLGRGVAARAKRSSWKRLLHGAAPTLRGADLSIVNLESPLAPCLSGGSVRTPRLCGDPQGIAALRGAGIDAVTLANNHALDAGPKGLRRTAQLLRRAGITPLGVQAALTGKPLAEYLSRITVVAVNLTRPALAPGRQVGLPTPAAVAAEIRRARRTAPHRPVLLLAHLGREYDPYPGPRERAFGRAAVTAGAAAVLLHGSHVRRAQVHDRGVPVHLGLGNLLFDQRDPRTRTGALVTLRLASGRSAQVLAERCVDSHSGTLMRCPKHHGSPAPHRN